MTGFLGKKFKIKPWIRRIITRICSIVPAIIIAFIFGSNGLTKLLLFSQVILSIQLPFALWPLIYFTSNSKIMTISMSNDTEQFDYSNGIFMKIIIIFFGILLTFLNIYLLIKTF